MSKEWSGTRRSAFLICAMALEMEAQPSRASSLQYGAIVEQGPIA